MIRLSVMYQNNPGTTFNWDYYLGPHGEIVERELKPLGLVKLEVDKGLSGFPPGAPPPYHAVGHLFFESMETLAAAVGAAGPKVLADLPNFTNAPTTMLVSQVTE